MISNLAKVCGCASHNFVGLNDGISESPDFPIDWLNTPISKPCREFFINRQPARTTAIISAASPRLGLVVAFSQDFVSFVFFVVSFEFCPANFLFFTRFPSILF